MRVAYQRQQAEELMTLEELRTHLGELDGRRAEAERERRARSGGEPASRAASSLPTQSRRTAAEPGSAPDALGMLPGTQVRPAEPVGDRGLSLGTTFIHH
jgi:hypothetical protein